MPTKKEIMLGLIKEIRGEMEIYNGVDTNINVGWCWEKVDLSDALDDLEKLRCLIEEVEDGQEVSDPTGRR